MKTPTYTEGDLVFLAIKKCVVRKETKDLLELDIQTSNSLQNTLTIKKDSNDFEIIKYKTALPDTGDNMKNDSTTTTAKQKKIKVTKIEIETTSGKKIKLLFEEARELYQQLDRIFGSKTTLPFPYQHPVVIESDKNLFPYKPQTTYTPIPIWYGTDVIV